ncbi:DUF6090 family protein [Roseivirga misakiensis]|uniref:Uncharacterized protein n=1 Tax=Roseivirga misakiensis TaxID=1563681 RepID=A0A1E5T096_9BACT|nr:DUF6090 family protein [Roseivirga misakiensis]OEK04793.1 hypothetical protein BFP71_15215 [Roseivirga misakiensis]
MAKQKISWKQHFIELIVVIIGISIAFTLEGWSDSKKERKLEQNYLNSIKSDLEKDRTDLQLIYDSTNTVLRYVGEVFYFIGTNAPLESYKFHHATSGYLATHFYPKNGTYTSMVNSGDLNLIQDFELRADLSDLYNVEYKELERADRVVQNLSDNHIQPYIISNIEFTRDKSENGILDDAPLKTKKAFNLLGSYYNLLSGRQMAYQKMIAKCDSLIVRIENLK